MSIVQNRQYVKHQKKCRLITGMNNLNPLKRYGFGVITVPLIVRTFVPPSMLAVTVTVL
jgi:hypothetical protein